MKIVLNRNNNKITFEGKEVKINPQSSKGENQEVVDLDSLHIEELTQYQRYISLSKLNEGDNEIDLKPRKNVSILHLTKEEIEEIENLENRIKEIKENAKKRSVKKFDLSKVKIEELTEEDRKTLEEYLTSLLNLKK